MSCEFTVFSCILMSGVETKAYLVCGRNKNLKCPEWNISIIIRWTADFITNIYTSLRMNITTFGDPLLFLQQ